MWIVVNIGCIECGVSSNVVGVFSDESRATEIADQFQKKYAWREGGQNSFEVFPMPVVDGVDAEYSVDG